MGAFRFGVDSSHVMTVALVRTGPTSEGDRSRAEPSCGEPLRHPPGNPQLLPLSVHREPSLTSALVAGGGRPG